MIEKRDREYIGDNDFNIGLGRVVLEGGYHNKTCRQVTADRVYAFSNENVGAYLNKYNLEGKKVATVGSSGDQLLNAILHGASDVTLIDGNPLARYYVELKLASIKNLSFNEFFDYFTPTNILSPKYYAKISHDLSQEGKLFWDNIMLLDIDDFALWDVYANIFHEYLPEHKMSNSYYENLVEFEKLKVLVSEVNINYLLAEFSEFPRRLKGEKFDYILLSNICDYVGDDTFNKVVKCLYNNNLNMGGAVQINYNFSTSRIVIKDFKELQSLCHNSKFRRILVKSASDYNDPDPSYASSEFLEKGEM